MLIQRGVLLEQPELCEMGNYNINSLIKSHFWLDVVGAPILDRINTGILSYQSEMF